MKPIILGTAGHIDHGKTALIRALTGIDTDRLKEEKERGITIELGFAFLTLPQGQLVGIVDVPGHEKFVHHMVAGVAGIDLVALVIAADEGVMPQTKEHLDICSLLKVKKGLVVITKIDLVEPDWLELVEEDIREFLKGTFLEDAPVIKVSSVTKEGIPELIATLEKLVQEIPPKSIETLFRLPIDRVFTVRGFGTVVTGTTIGGRVKTGDSLMIYPQGIKTKARSIQVHGRDVEEAIGGQRTAINLQGIEKNKVARGSILAPPQSLIPSFMLDAQLEILPGCPKPIKNRTLVRLHLYTKEALAYLILLDKEELKPGEVGLVQFRIQEPVVALPGDRFIIRSYSPIITIGGGFVLHPAPSKHKRFKPEVIRDLKVLVSGDLPQKVLSLLHEARYKGLSMNTLKVYINASNKDLRKVLEELIASNQIYCINHDKTIYVHSAFIKGLWDKIVCFLQGFHKTYPLLLGIPKEELRTKLLPFISEELFDFLLKRMEEKGEIVIAQHRVRLGSHEIKLSQKDLQLKRAISQMFKEAAYTPPSPKEIAQKLGVEKEKVDHLLRLLTEEGKIVKIKENFFCDAQLLNQLKEQLIDYLKRHGSIAPADLKGLTHASRKFNIPLLEYFDRIKLTVRKGDKRVLFQV